MLLSRIGAAMVLLRVRLNVGMHRKCDGIIAINYLPYVPLWQKKKRATGPKRWNSGEGYGILGQPGALKGGISEKEIAIFEL